MPEQNEVVFRAADGRTLTLDDLRGFTGEVRWEILGQQSASPVAIRLHEQAREAGEQGQFDLAIQMLTKASELAPEWPYPVYDRAFTHLLMKNAGAARVDYQKTVELAPRGFFTAITAVDTLNREHAGDLPSGVYLAYVSLDSITDRREKLNLVRQMAEKFPRFAPAWKDYAMLLDGDGERLSAIEQGLAAVPDGETRGTLIINKALLLENAGRRSEAISLLGDLALDPEATLANEQLAKATLGLILRK